MATDIRRDPLFEVNERWLAGVLHQGREAGDLHFCGEPVEEEEAAVEPAPATDTTRWCLAAPAAGAHNLQMAIPSLRRSRVEPSKRINESSRVSRQAEKLTTNEKSRTLCPSRLTMIQYGTGKKSPAGR